MVRATFRPEDIQHIAVPIPHVHQGRGATVGFYLLVGIRSVDLHQAQGWLDDELLDLPPGTGARPCVTHQQRVVADRVPRPRASLGPVSRVLRVTQVRDHVHVFCPQAQIEPIAMRVSLLVPIVDGEGAAVLRGPGLKVRLTVPTEVFTPEFWWTPLSHCLNLPGKDVRFLPIDVIGKAEG